MVMIASVPFLRTVKGGVCHPPCTVCYNHAGADIAPQYNVRRVTAMQTLVKKVSQGTLPSCIECTERFECGVGNASLCKGFSRDMGVLSPPCITCERRSGCLTWKECVNCGKKEDIKSVSQSASAPGLKKYALRLAEFLPFEAEWATVDSQAIRLFLGEPFYRKGKWCAGPDGREICTVSYEDGMLNGIVDLGEFLEYKDGPIGFSMAKITL